MSYNNQLMVVYQYFTNIAAKQNVGYCNKFDATKSLGVCYWYVNIPQCRYMWHGLKLIMFYVQKHIAALEMCHNQPLVRHKPLGAPASVKLVYWKTALSLSLDFDLFITILGMYGYWQATTGILVTISFKWLVKLFAPPHCIPRICEKGTCYNNVTV